MFDEPRSLAWNGGRRVGSSALELCNNAGAMNRRICIRSLLLIAFVTSSLFLFAQSTTAPSTPSASAADGLVKQGQELVKQGKLDEALGLYQQALRESPNLFSADLAAGIALDLKGEYTQARQYLQKAIDEAPVDAKNQALRTMAISYAFQRNSAEAAKYEQPVFNSLLAAQRFADAAGVADELARIYLECGDFDNAYKWYQTGNTTALRDPKLTDAEKDLWAFRWENAQARIAARRGQPAEAQQHLAAAKAILDKGDNPEQAQFFPYLAGYVAFYANDYKTAIADLQKADQHDPFVLVLLAQAYEKSGDQQQAMDYYRRVLAISTHNPTSAFARPIAQKKMGPSATGNS